MKNLKNVLLILSLFVSSLVFAQEYSFISDDLHEMTNEEMVEYQVQFSPDVPMYDHEGNKISPDQINSIMESGNFMPVIFADKDHKLKAIVFRQTTAEEKEMLRQAMAYQNPYGDFVAGEEVPNVVATDIDGKEVNLHDLKGKVIVLNFWYTTCAPCVSEMPELNKIVEKYKDSDVVFISITHESKEKVNDFLKNTDFNFQHLVANEELLNVFGIKAFPTTIVVNKDSTMLLKQLGDITKTLDTVLEELTKI